MTTVRIVIVIVLFVCTVSAPGNEDDYGGAGASGDYGRYGVGEGEELDMSHLEPVRVGNSVVPAGKLEHAKKMFEDAGVNKWPVSGTMRIAPVIDISVLSDANMVGEERLLYGRTYDDEWMGKTLQLRWHVLVANPRWEELELPERRTAYIIGRMPEDVRQDPNLVEERLAKELATYREQRKRVRAGMLDIDMWVAPSGKAANEWLLVSWLFDTRGVRPKGLFSRKVEGLGTVAFDNDPVLQFVRDNIAVKIEADGKFSAEAMAVAFRIDDMIKKQPVMTIEELEKRRPVVEISTEITKHPHAAYYEPYTRKGWVSFTAEPPEGAEIVRVEAYVDGNQASVKDGKIWLEWEKIGDTRTVKVTAISSELLAGTAEVQIQLKE